MRNITTLLVATLLITSSCKNIEKMVDKGNYDEAINYAVSKLEGKKDKPTKYVRALERAYNKVNTRDLNSIQKLLVSSNTNRYDKIYDIYIAMERRQASVLRLHPLVSKDGYVADMDNTNYTPLLSTTAALASESNYMRAGQLITQAIKGDKTAARLAYKTLGYIERYDNNYKRTDSLFAKAYELGVDHIGVEVRVNAHSPVQYVLTETLHNMDISSLDDLWTRHHLNPSVHIPLDYVATIQIDNIEPGFEKEFYNRYEDTKQIEDGTKPVKDLNGNVVKDTLGNIIYTKKYRTTKAYVTELHREKSASLSGKTLIYDINTNSLVKSVPLSVTHLFDDYAATYQGEYTALSENSRRLIRNTCANFPSDYEMVMAMAANFRDGAYEVLDSRYRRDY